MSGNQTVREYLTDPSKARCHNFYDWFCRDTSLPRKAEVLTAKVRQLAASSKINQDTMYCWFKNNCPMVGTLYDDLRFADCETGDTLYTVIPAVGYEASKRELREGKRTGLAEVWGRENNFDGPLVVGTWRDVRKFFGV